MELVRSILLKMADEPSGYARQPFVVTGYSDEVVGHHVWLMEQARLVTASDVTGMGDSSPISIPLSITWNGYEFLDNAKDPSTWSRGVEMAKRAGSSSFEVIAKALVEVAISQLTGRP